MNKNSLSTSIGDYRDVEILPGSIIYCDPPYRETREYCKQTFDYESFYDWCEKQTAIVVYIISCTAFLYGSISRE